MKKLTPKRKEALIRVLEALKSQNCIKSYRMEGDDLRSVETEWVEGGAERAFEELMRNVQPFGVRQSDAAWMGWLLPKEWRERFTDAMLVRAKESALQLCRMILKT